MQMEYSGVILIDLPHIEMPLCSMPVSMKLYSFKCAFAVCHEANAGLFHLKYCSAVDCYLVCKYFIRDVVK